MTDWLRTLGACVKVLAMSDEKPIVTVSGPSEPDDALHEDVVRSTLPALGVMSTLTMAGLAGAAAVGDLGTAAVAGLAAATGLLTVLSIVTWMWREWLPIPEVVAVSMVLFPAGGRGGGAGPVR